MSARKKKKKPTFEFRRKKQMTLKLFEFVEQFMMDTFMIKITQFEKTGSIGKTFISLGNLMISFHFQICCSIVEFAFLLKIKMH